MKYFGTCCLYFSLVIISFTACSQKQNATHLPKPISWVNDFEHIFTSEQVTTLDSIIGRYEKETTNQISVVTLDTVFNSEEELAAYSLVLARHWGVGKKEKNNGMLIVFGVKMRMIRIQNGYETEKKLSDKKTKEIIDHIILPEFKKSNYFEGIKNALVVIMEEIR